ncbi:MAG: hypothetical protein L0Y71_16875 [Gemmataceae bacterium]|nr:hypothetical protein [Gemmataceae bacterium]
MHHKYAKDGLAVISVALDDIHSEDDPDALKRVEAFLRAKKAAITNLLLDEPIALWQERLRFVAPPCQYVFSRHGKWTKFDTDKEPIDHKAVEKLVVELLAEK